MQIIKKYYYYKQEKIISQKEGRGWQILRAPEGLRFPCQNYYEEVKDLMKHYENYASVNVDKLVNVPMDYNGIMGVPMTYLKKRNDDIFRIIGLGSAHSIASGLQYEVDYTDSKIDHGGNPVVDGHLTYVRIFIKNITI